MEELLKKLNFNNQPQVVLLNVPPELETFAQYISTKTQLVTDLPAANNITFALFFITQQEQIDQIADSLAAKLSGDATVWFAYPKQTSKNYKCNFNRDNGWAALGKINMEGVRMVAINQDWSALRFRKTAYIKTITRRQSMILSEEGKEKINRQ